MGEGPWQVVLLPGGVMPAGPAYGALLAELGPDVDPAPAPPGPPPPWMASRPAGLHAVLRAFYASDLDLARMRRFD